MAIQRISVNKTNHAIRWIVIYPVDSVIQPLNNRALGCNLSYIVDLFAALHELASARARTLLKLASSKSPHFHVCPEAFVDLETWSSNFSTGGAVVQDGGLCSNISFGVGNLSSSQGSR